jgi:hypothetical protein
MTIGAKAPRANATASPDQGTQTSHTTSERQDKRADGNRKITFA